MRAIKFRGKTSGGEWVYGNLIVGNIEGRSFYQIEHSNFDDYSNWEVDSKTVGQYTGLHDKNGKEVWEGDVLHNVVYGHKFVVEWGIEGDSYAGWAGNWLGKTFVAPLYNGPMENCEVVGNRHDNPKLLEAESA